MKNSKAANQKEDQRTLDNIPITLERDAVLKFLKMDRFRDKAEKIVDELLELVRPVARPKALFRVACVGEQDRDWVEINGVRFTSRVLSKSLAEIDTVIPYIVTSGQELDELPVSQKDFLRYYCLDAIKTTVLFQASRYFMDYLKENYDLPDYTHLHPGEFADWPISEQGPLFSLFENTEKAIGVKLTSTKTIQPIKSGSGILFSNGATFESCALCTMKCPGRRAAYNPELKKRLMD